jgi:protein-S-isoprenylcysteine O-methyltransferase Ste14
VPNPYDVSDESVFVVSLVCFVVILNVAAKVDFFFLDKKAQNKPKKAILPFFKINSTIFFLIFGFKFFHLIGKIQI